MIYKEGLLCENCTLQLIHRVLCRLLSLLSSAWKTHISEIEEYHTREQLPLRAKYIARIERIHNRQYYVHKVFTYTPQLPALSRGC